MTDPRPPLFLPRQEWNAMVKALNVLYYGAELARRTGESVEVRDGTGLIATIDPDAARKILDVRGAVTHSTWTPPIERGFTPDE